MKLSTRSTYGMRALVELGLAGGFTPVSAAAIAKRQGLSVAYLEQLLHRLKRQGIVASIRGPRGGYVLAKEPQQITMADVVKVLDGVNGKAKEPHRHAQRITQAVWRCVHERLTQSLSEVTLQDLCDEAGVEAAEPLEHRYVFHI